MRRAGVERGGTEVDWVRFFAFLRASSWVPFLRRRRKKMVLRFGCEGLRVEGEIRRRVNGGSAEAVAGGTRKDDHHLHLHGYDQGI